VRWWQPQLPTIHFFTAKRRKPRNDATVEYERLSSQARRLCKDGNSVHLPTKFVRHYTKRDEGRLPTIVAISTLALVLADANVLAE
jgi:hypothetical protein